MIQVTLGRGNVGSLSPPAPRHVFRDLWVEVPNYANPKLKGTRHACFCQVKGDSSFIIPHAWAIKKEWCSGFSSRTKVDAEDKNDANNPCRSTRYVFRGSLDPNRFQDRAVEGVFRAFKERNSALLCMPCGYGKTVTALSILANMPGRTRMLVFAHKNFLLDQWKERAEFFLGVEEHTYLGRSDARPVSVGRYQGTRSDCDWERFDIICASLATVARRLADADPSAGKLMRGSTDPKDTLIVVYDEAHHVPANTWLRTFFCLRARPGLSVLGLSATPRRADGLDVFLGACFGLPFVAPVEEARLQRQRTTVSMSKNVGQRLYEQMPAACVHILQHDFGPCRMPISRRTGRPDFNAFLQEIVTCQGSIDLIAAEVMRQLKDPLTTSVLILSHRVSHVKAIVRNLPQRYAQALYGGQTKAEKLQGHKFERRVVASTYAYLSEGFDCKKFNVLILATPKKDVEQAIGRIARDRGARWRAARDAILNSQISPYMAAGTPETIASLAVNTKSLVVDVAQGRYALRQRRSIYAKRELNVRVLRA